MERTSLNADFFLQKMLKGW